MEFKLWQSDWASVCSVSLNSNQKDAKGPAAEVYLNISHEALTTQPVSDQSMAAIQWK